MSRGSAAPRRGFTLLEVTVALAVTGVVVLLAYGIARAGIDAEARLARADADARAAVAARALLRDALRHAEDGVADDDTVFVLERTRDARGRVTDRLRFVSRGVVPPLGAGTRWALSAEVTAEGLEVLAVPADGRVAAARAIVPGVASLRARVLARGATAWDDAWPRPQSAPAAVALTLADSAGRPVGAALVARTRPEAP